MRHCQGNVGKSAALPPEELTPGTRFPPAFNRVADVLRYLNGRGLTRSRSMLYLDIKDGLLPRQEDGSFRRRDLYRYCRYLLGRYVPGMDRARYELRNQKTRADIDRIRSIVRGQNLRLGLREGLYCLAEEVRREHSERWRAMEARFLREFEINTYYFPKQYKEALLDSFAGLLRIMIRTYGRPLESVEHRPTWGYEDDEDDEEDY